MHVFWLTKYAVGGGISASRSQIKDHPVRPTPNIQMHAYMHAITDDVSQLSQL